MVLIPPGRILGLGRHVADVAMPAAPTETQIWWRLSYEVRRPAPGDSTANAPLWERIERITRDEQGVRAQLGGICRLQERGDDSVRNQKLERADVAWRMVD